MKIALVSPYDYATPGGVNAHISNLAKEFTNYDHRVTILAPTSKAIDTDDYINFIGMGRPIPIPYGGSTARLSISPWLIKRIRKLLADEKFDIIHLHEPLAPILPWLFLKTSNTVNIGTFHAFHEKSKYYYITKSALRYWFKKLNGRIAVSESAMNFVAEHFKSNYALIPNGIDINKFSMSTRSIEHLSNNQPTILFVGRIGEKRKGLKYLLKAYSYLKWNHPDLRLIIVGPGDLDKDCHRLLSEHNLSDVVFTGSVSETDLIKYYKSATIFCSPATGQESFGIVLLEAMASGVPIIASSIQGYSAVVENGVQGLLVEPENPLDLSKKLDFLLKNSTIRQYLSKEGPIRASKFSWKNIASEVLAYYKETRIDWFREKK
jgi:phosphatidylinositol alpha-mannosyltransferase